MKASLARATACSLSLMLLPVAGYLSAASAQSMSAQTTAAGAMAAPVQLAQQLIPAPAYAPPQLDQLLAPIALYPDPLLAQILMASTYPLEVVAASRWVQDPSNAALRGDQLDAALQQLDWDPSVKSLVPFPQILQMMNSRLDWMQALGNAFLAQQADVMDSVQRLRAEALAAGTLHSTPQATVSIQGQTILILPADPQLVYVPYYNPAVVYGVWGYPAYPPIYFPPPRYAYVAGPGIYFGIGFGIVGVLWGWGDWDWNHHEIHIDRDRYNRINNYVIVHDNRPRYTENTWRHDPAHRRGVPYGNPEIRQKFQRASPGSADARRDFRGFDDRGAAPPAASRPAEAERPSARQPVTGPQATGRQGLPRDGQRAGEAGRVGRAGPPTAPTPQAAPRVMTPPPQPSARVVTPPPQPSARVVTPPPQPSARVAPPPPAQRAPVAAPLPTVQRPAAPAFSGFGRGPDVRAQSQRGETSRQSMPPAAAPPRAAAPHQRGAPPPQQQQRGGGQKGGDNDKQRN